MSKYCNIAVIFWVSILASFFVATFSQVRLIGDGAEYLLCASAFSSHYSPDMRTEDVRVFDKSDPNFRENQKTLGTWYRLKNGVGYGGGFVRALDGTMYSWHFWLYSAFVAPFLSVTQWLDISPLYACVLCNWVFVLVTLTYMAFSWKASKLQKQVLLILFLLNGTSYYIWWTHPEVFTASLILLALMLASDKKFGFAMFASGLAATQNPPVIFTLLFIAALSFIEGYHKNIDKLSILSLLKITRINTILFFLALIIALSPVIFFMATLGVPNPISETDFVDSSLISLSRLQSLYFDLNLGMITAQPGVFFGVVALQYLIVTSMFKSKQITTVLSQNKFLLSGILLSIIMALPSLSTQNWNHGLSVFSRYAYWLSIPIIFGLVTSLGSLKRRTSIIISVTIIMLQTFTVAYYGFWGNNERSDFLTFKPISNYILLNFPNLYNPVPEIFIERLLHREGALSLRGVDGNTYVYPDKINPTKILLPIDKASRISDSCPSISLFKTEGDRAYLSFRGQEKCVLDIL